MESLRHPIVEEDLRKIVATRLPWHMFGGKSALITGATGLVGGYLVETLLYRNEVIPGPPCQVIALARDRARAESRFAFYRSRPDFQLLIQNVEDQLDSDIHADFIIHAAGNASPKLFGADPVGTYRGALLGTHMLLEHAHRSGCEGFLLLSSGAVHGSVSSEHAVVDETVIGSVDPMDPYACYAETKRMAETMCASWFRQFGTPTRIARLGHTYGPGLRKSDDRAFAQFIHSIVEGSDIMLRTDGSAVRPYCYLTDAVNALFRILLLGKKGEAYLVVNPTASKSVFELAKMLVELFPERGSRVQFAQSVHPGAVVNMDPYRPIDVSKLRSLGWSPEIGVNEGFERTLRSIL